MKLNKSKVQFWRRIQRTRTKNSTVGQPGIQLKASPPSLLNTLPDVLQLCLQVERTAAAVPHSIENSQLRPPSLIADAPLKLWLKLLDSETLESLHRKSVVASAKAMLLGEHDAAAISANRIRETTTRELQHRRTASPSQSNPSLGA